VLPFMELPVVVELAAWPPEAELPQALAPGPVPALWENAEVVESNSADARVSVADFSIILSIARATPRNILFQRSITSDSRCDRASARRVRKLAWWCNQLALVCILGSGAHMTNAAGPDRPALGFPVSAGIFIGLGLGGFFDGIVFHQLLQWHHMLSGWYPINSPENLKLNIFWDGIFHSGTYVLMLIGLFYSLAYRSPAAPDLVERIAGWTIIRLIRAFVSHCRRLLEIAAIKFSLLGGNVALFVSPNWGWREPPRPPTRRAVNYVTGCHRSNVC
jgi:hypothetical protein